jgi:hypothetical protein
MEAGCQMKEWKKNDAGFAYKFHWIPSGTLLENDACVNHNYSKDVLPVKEKRYVSATIAYQKVREVDANKQSVSLDLNLWMRWKDPGVKFKFSDESLENNGIFLGPNATSKIWIPDANIKNRTYFKEDEEWKSLISSKILSETEEIELKYEMKFSVFCVFDYLRYPMDEQTCNVSIGSSSQSEIFVLRPSLNDTNRIYHVERKYQSDNFYMSTKFFDKKIDDGTNTIGIFITMCRLQHSFIFMYYIPCITIVLVSLIGFVIPVSAIPGRIGLLVTQFLTLTNLSIHQMVNIIIVILMWLNLYFLYILSPNVNNIC